MECPRCKLENPQSALRCDCGYDFATGQMETPYAEIERLRRAPRLAQDEPARPRRLSAEELEEQSRAQRDMLVGGLWCVGGIAATIFSYTSASQAGGRYIFAWGAILWGFAQFMRGFGK